MSQYAYSLILLATIAWSLPVNDDECDKQVGRFKKANLSLAGTVERKSAASILFNKIDENFLEDLVNEEDDNVGIRAAWQDAANQLFVPGFVVDYREECRAQIARFVGRLEGRLQVSVPEYWTNSLRAMEFYSDRPGQLDGEVQWSFESPNVISRIGDSIYSGTSDIENMGVGTLGQLRLRGKEAFLITKQGESLAVSVTPLTAFDILESGDSVVVLECRRLSGLAYKLRFCERDGQTLMEKTTVIRRLIGSESGTRTIGHVCFITSSKKHYCIWGISGEGCYLDVFDKQSLSLIVAFHTAH